jgi:PBSX family phage terminase large subunit
MATATRSRTRRRPGPPPDLRYHGAALDLLKSHDFELVIVGPAGTGKSIAALHKLHWAAQHYPDMRGLIVRKTRESLTQSALVTFEDKVLGPWWRERIAANCQRRVRQSYTYPNGSELVVGGLDKPSKVMSTEYDIAYAQEAIELTEGDWESLNSRVRNGVMPYQQLFGDTNPDAPTHWIKRRAEGGQLRLLESRHEDNPAYWDHAAADWTEKGRAYIARLDRLTGPRFLRLRKGQWAGAEGAIYDEFDRRVHVVETYSPPPSDRIVRSIDFGYVNPFVCQWWAIDHDGRMTLFKELYGTGRLVSDWAADIQRHSAGMAIEATISDHDAEDRATLDAAGISTDAAHKAVTPGIEAVQRRLRIEGDGRPRIQFAADAVVRRDPRLIEARKPACTLEEIEGYTWAPPTPNRPPKDEPRKANDHGMDALRYSCAYVDGLGGPAELGVIEDPWADVRW